MHPRTDHHWTKRAPRNSAPISPSVRASEAPLYRELAAAANDAGFADVTASQVHEWVKAGLLPPTGDQVSHGRHGFITERRSGVTNQLLALCRWRKQTKSWARLALLLWADGWPIDVERVRAAVLDWFPQPLPTDPTDERLDEWSRMAARLAPKFSAWLGLGRVAPGVADGLYQGILVMAGQGEETLDEEGATAIETAAGMRPRARTDRLGDLGPWLDGPALDGFSVMPKFTHERLRSLVASASSADMAAARPRVRFLLIELPGFVRALELLMGRNFLGVGAIPRLIVRAPEISLPIALFFAADAPELATELDKLYAAFPEVRVGPAVEWLERYVAEHPQKAAAIRQAGLQGLLGEAVPCE